MPHLKASNHVTCHTHVFRKGMGSKKKALPHLQHKRLQEEHQFSCLLSPHHPQPQATRNDSTPGRTDAALG